MFAGSPAIAGFAVAILPLIVTPGASLTLLTTRVAQRGPREAAPVVLGTITGLYVHATLAAVGLSALVMRSSELFTVVRVAGAAYLVGLGIVTLRGRPRRAVVVTPRSRSTYVQALLGNVLNPKAASIFLTLAPQFVDPHRPLLPQMFVLATAQATLVTTWLLMWAIVIARARRSIRSDRFGAVARRVAGTVLIALGLRAAVA